MQNMWISVALIVAVIIVGIIAGKRLSTPGPQRRAVYFAFGTLAVLALWFFIFVAFFPAEWIVPFFTVACIIIPICVYMMVLRSGGKERAKVPSKRSFEIPKKDITVESAKAASTVSSGTASASSATTPSKAATPAPSASQQTAPASSTPTSAAKTDTSSAPATKAKAPATAAVATAPTKPATSEAPKATAKPSAEAPKPTQPASKAEAPSTQKSTTESAPVARLHRRSLLNPQNLPSLKKPNPRSPQSKRPSPLLTKLQASLLRTRSTWPRAPSKRQRRKRPNLLLRLLLPPLLQAKTNCAKLRDRNPRRSRSGRRSCQDRRARSSFCFASNPYYERREGARAECWRTGQLIERKNTHKQGSYTR